MIRKYHAVYDDDTEEFIGIDLDGVFLDANAIVDTLNNYDKTIAHLEKTREQLYKERDTLVTKEHKYQDIITGVMAFIELRVKEEIWSDWND